MKLRMLRTLLVLIETWVGITAVAGGIGLMLTNGLGMPTEYLNDTPFQNYLIPGLILAGIIGGTNITASFMTIRKTPRYQEFSAIAGFGLNIWIFTEIFLLRQPHLLQAVYFLLAIIILIATMLLVRYDNNKNVSKITD